MSTKLPHIFIILPIENLYFLFIKFTSHYQAVLPMRITIWKRPRWNCDFKI